MTNQNSQRKRLYVLDSDEVRFSVVHISLKEAKKVLWADSDVRDCCDNEYVLFNPVWLRDVDVSDLNIGDSMDGIIGVERGVYGWVDDYCPMCGKCGSLSISGDWDVICCSNCDERIYQEYKSALVAPCDAHPKTGGDK